MQNLKRLKDCPGKEFSGCGRIIGKLLLKSEKKHGKKEYFLCDKHFKEYADYGKDRWYSWYGAPLTNGELREVENAGKPVDIPW